MRLSRPTRRTFLQQCAAAGTASFALQPCNAAAPPPAETKLDGVSVAARARAVVEMSAGNCWFPDLLRFSTGELMLTHSLNGDSNENQHNSQALHLSTDGGKTFDFGYDVNGFHNGGGEPRIALPDGRDRRYVNLPASRPGGAGPSVRRPPLDLPRRRPAVHGGTVGREGRGLAEGCDPRPAGHEPHVVGPHQLVQRHPRAGEGSVGLDALAPPRRRPAREHRRARVDGRRLRLAIPVDDRGPGRRCRTPRRASTSPAWCSSPTAT